MKLGVNVLWKILHELVMLSMENIDMGQKGQVSLENVSTEQQCTEKS